MKVFTTINPNGNFDIQHKALVSWSSKYQVFSINTKDEIKEISKLYPYVNFIETDIIYDYNEKKLIKLDSILLAIQKNCDNKSQVAIINSDIILNNDIKSSIFQNKYSNDLVIATRYEIDDEKIYPFDDGYDLFIFNTKYINLYKNKNYVIGLPWWDFWIPLISIKAGIKVYHIKNQLIYHKTHQTNYNKDIWIEFGEHLYKDIMITLMKNNVNNNVYSFCSSVKLFIEKNQINIKIK